jgi:hypothetical protein
LSFSIGIHLWWPPERGEQFQKLGRVLECIPLPVKYLELDGSEAVPKRFNRVVVFEECFATVFDRTMETDRVADVLTLLERYQRPDVSFVVGSVFNFLDRDQDKDETYTSAGPLDVNYYGVEYCLGGSYYKSRGPVQLTFSDTAAFANNYDAVLMELAKKIIAATDPVHLVVCTEAEVHPLTAHSIYHRNWSDYFNDLVRIARLHERGGVYFSELSETDPAFAAPRKATMDYGYLRGRFGDNSVAAFVAQLQRLLQGDGRVMKSKSVLDECFADLKHTMAERLNDSYLLTALGSPSSYLEEPYFKLFHRVTND